MKWLLLIGIICICVCASSTIIRGQSRVTYEIGVKSGVNMSRFTEKRTSNSYWVSYLVGLSVEQRFTQRLSLSYDLSYSRQGNMVFLTNPGLFDKVRTKYNYLILPVSIRYQLKRYPFILSPGFQVGYLLANRTDFLPKSGYTNNNVPYLRKTDIGFSLSLGYRFSPHFFGEAKYYQSLKTLFKTTPAERYNQVISAGLTYYPFTK